MIVYIVVEFVEDDGDTFTYSSAYSTKEKAEQAIKASTKRLVNDLKKDYEEVDIQKINDDMTEVRASYELYEDCVYYDAFRIDKSVIDG